MVDEIVEASHPDIDSALEMHIGTGDFSYKTRMVGGSTEHIVKRMKNSQWKDHFTIDADEVKTLDTGEMTTFLIHQIRMNRTTKRRTLGLFAIAMVIAAPIMLYAVLVLGIQTDGFEMFLIIGGIFVAFIPISCLVMSSAERSVDDGVFAIRPNLIDVFRKQMELKEAPYQKSPLQKRIDRLQRRDY